MNTYKEIIFFDIETTGFDKTGDDIIQFAAKKYADGGCTDELNVYIDHGRDVRRISAFIGPEPVLAGHNIDSFDVPFLTVFLARNRIDLVPAATVDTLSLSRRLLSQSPKLVRRTRGGARSMKLSDLTEQLGLADGIAFHNAFDDVEATVRLYGYLMQLADFMAAA